MEPNRTDLTKEEILRETFGEDVINQSQMFNHIIYDLPMLYPESRQRTFIYKSMESYSEQKEKPLLERIKSLEQALEANKEYAKFLSDYCSQIGPFLHVHNYGPSDEQVRRGEELRAKIAETEVTLNPL